MMRRRHPLKRAVATRAPKRKFIIYCEGMNTEPDYFRAVQKVLLGTLVDLEIINAVGVPMTIAEKACERAAAMKRFRRRTSSFEEFDQVWAVFDRDTHCKVPEATKQCKQNNVRVAFSNPCFELWLILHFKDFDRPDDHHQVQKALAKICRDYDPNGRKSADFSKFIPNIGDAERRAESQLTRRNEEGIPPKRPFTSVFHLTREIKNAHLAYAGVKSK